MIKTSLCKAVFLLSFAVSKSSLGRERSRLKRSLPEQFGCLDTKRTHPTGKLLPSPSQLRPNCTTFSVMFSCFHKFYISFFVKSNTKSFLIHKPSWDIDLKLGCKIDHVSQCTSLQHKMPDKFSSVVHFNTKRGLGNSLVLLSSENIAATHNKHAWETGKPKKCGSQCAFRHAKNSFEVNLCNI